MSERQDVGAALPATADPEDRRLLAALVRERGLSTVVPLVLERVERDPLRSAGCFSGDLVRGLMEVPGAFWTRHQQLHARFLAALRACALLRRYLPPDARMAFWTPLVPEAPGVPDDRSPEVIDDIVA